MRTFRNVVIVYLGMAIGYVLGSISDSFESNLLGHLVVLGPLVLLVLAYRWLKARRRNPPTK